MRPRRIFVVAGESSGDLHASKLLAQLKELIPNVAFIGIGGKRMSEVGLESIVPLEKVSVVGFAEVLKNLNFFRKTLSHCKEILSAGDIDLVILVDFPGFNLRLAEIASSLGIPVCYYIAPQLWAWGQQRIKKIEKFVDLLLVVFPFEKEFFSRFRTNVEFVGHPLLDEPIFQVRMLPFDERQNWIAILPGSRKSEINYHKKLVFEIIEQLAKELPDYEIKIPSVNSSFFDDLTIQIQKKFPFVIFEQNAYDLMHSSKIGIIKSGTSNLEAALLGLPFVMFYKTSFITYSIAKQLVKLNYISIVNLLLNGSYVPEFIQKDANANNIVKSIKSILSDIEIYHSMQTAFTRIKDLLGGQGAAERAAKKIVNFFGL